MIEDIIDRVERENLGKKNKKVVQKSDFMVIDDDFIKLETNNYEQHVWTETENIVKDIRRNLKHQVKKMTVQMEPWKKSSFLRMGSTKDNQKIEFLLQPNASV